MLIKNVFECVKALTVLRGESAVHDAVKREDVEMIKLLAAPRANGEKIADRM